MLITQNREFWILKSSQKYSAPEKQRVVATCGERSEFTQKCWRKLAIPAVKPWALAADRN
jgi:hypothetical protein